MDPASYGGVPGVSTAHYLVKMIHDILKGLDNNSKGIVSAAISTFYDWSKAFDRQCHKLGILSFLKCGVRSSLIPVLISYFENRSMTVKYRSATSTERALPGGGAQGTLIGPIEYECQSNENANSVDVNRRYKFVDDLPTLEIVLIASKISTHNLKNQVPSDVGVHNQVIDKEQLESQNTLNSIKIWTDNQKMKLNEKKTKYMITNFCTNYQFNTRL